MTATPSPTTPAAHSRRSPFARAPLLLAALLLTAIGAAQVQPEAVELFERARAAHGGEALEGLSSYREEGMLIAYDTDGLPAQETPVRTLLDLDGRRVRMEVLQGGEVALVQQVTPSSAFAWSAQAGEIPLTDEQADELRLTLDLGVYGIRRGVEDAQRAVVLGDRTFEGATGTAVEVTRDGRTVTFLFGDDGRLLADRYVTAQLGEVTNLYRGFETTDGVLLPTGYDSYAMGGKLLGLRVESLEANPSLADAFATEGLAAPAGATPEVLAWLGDAAHPLDSVRAGTGLEDLEAFGDIVGDARIVAVGEQTHGTSEFFRLKGRLLEYLVREKGFTLFAIEANLPEAERLNRYVLTGEGDPAELLEGLHFWTWNTREVLDMIAWMRGYNRTAPTPVQFTGFDMQYPGLAMRNLRDFLADVDPDYLREITATLTEVQAGSPSVTTAGYPADRLRALQREVDAIAAHVQANRDAYLERAGEDEVERAILHARLVAQAVGLQQGGVAWRDAAMARNIGWLLERNPGERMMIWAHNGHVAQRGGWMGGYLDTAYGEDYLAVGLSFFEGAYRARSAQGGAVGRHVAQPALAGSVEALLNRVGPERFMLDLRGVEASPAAAWLAEERLFRSIGAVARPAGAAFAPRVLAEDFDALIFVRESTASEPAR